MTHAFIPARRRILSAAAGSAVVGVGLPTFAQAKEFKVGFFIALSGPAALFGPTQRACADLAMEKINKAGGIMGRPVKLLFTDAGGPPAETGTIIVMACAGNACTWAATGKAGSTTAPAARDRKSVV